ncbi:hypothetical protein WI89_32015 [Burkholderia ubonensis]|nr:hypothetical protein WI89_32015 [Burkholderia ubonensis]
MRTFGRGQPRVVGCLDLSDIEHIAPARQGTHDVLVLTAQRRAHFADALDEGIISDDDIAPHGLDQFVSAEQSTGIPREMQQQRERLGS